MSDPPRKRKSDALILTTIVALVSIVAVFDRYREVITVAKSAAENNAGPNRFAHSHLVTYQVKGSADVSYSNETDGMSTDHSFDGIPLRKAILLPYANTAWLHAQNRLSGSIIAEILVDNVVIKHATCDGEYCIAQVSWSAAVENIP